MSTVTGGNSQRSRDPQLICTCHDWDNKNQWTHKSTKQNKWELFFDKKMNVTVINRSVSNLRILSQRIKIKTLVQVTNDIGEKWPDDMLQSNLEASATEATTNQNWRYCARDCRKIAVYQHSNKMALKMQITKMTIQTHQKYTLSKKGKCVRLLNKEHPHGET